MGRSGTSACAVFALFNHFCYVGGFWQPRCPCGTHSQGCEWDVVIVYAYYDTERRFLQSLALLRAAHNPFQRRKMTVSSNNGLVNGLVHNLLMHFFTLGSSKIEVFETYFFHTMTNQNEHPSFVKHVLGHLYMHFTLFGYWAHGGGGVSEGMGIRPPYAVFHPR